MSIFSIFSKSFFLTLSTALIAVYQFCLTIFISRQQGVEALGSYSYAIAILNPLFLLLYQSYRVHIVTDIKEIYSPNDFFNNRLFLTVIFLPIVILLSLYFQNAFFILIFFIKSIEGFVDLIIAYQNKNKDIINSAKINFFYAMLNFLVLIFAFVIDLSIYYLLMIIILFMLIKLFLYDFRFLDKGLNFKKDYKQTFGKIVNIWQEVRSLVFAGFVGGLVYNIPKYFFGDNVKDLGVFTAVTAFSLGFNLIAATLGQSIQPWLVSYYKTDRRKFLLISISSLVILTLLLLIFLVIIIPFYDIYSKQLFKIDFSFNDFIKVNLLFLPLYIGQLLSFMNTAVRQYKSIFIINVISLIMAVISGFITFKITDSIYAAAIVYFLIGIIQMVGYVYSLRQALKNTFHSF